MFKCIGCNKIILEKGETQQLVDFYKKDKKKLIELFNFRSSLCLDCCRDININIDVYMPSCFINILEYCRKDVLSELKSKSSCSNCKNKFNCPHTAHFGKCAKYKPLSQVVYFRIRELLSEIYEPLVAVFDRFDFGVNFKYLITRNSMIKYLDKRFYDMYGKHVNYH